MVKAGIIDSFKVIRTALVDAASASLLLATTEAAIIDAQGAKNPLKSAFHLRSAIKKSSAKLDQEKAQERLSKLSGGVAVFKDGGAIEAEVAKRKDRVTDYLNATRAAVEESIIAGGGVALLYAPKVLRDLQTANEELKL